MSQQEIPLPNDLNAEAGVLSACLIGKKAIVQALTGNLSESDFYRNSHKLVFRAMTELYTEGVGVDTITLSNRMKNDKTFDKAGGFEFINSLSNFVMSGSNIKEHINIVKETSRLRQFRILAANMAESDLSSTEMFKSYNDQLAKIMSDAIDTGITSLSEISDALEQKYDEGVELLKSYPTHINNIDHYLTMSEGNLVVLAASTAMGKSSLARQLAYNWASIGHHHVGLFTLEMDKEEVVICLKSMAGEIDSKDIYDHTMNEYEVTRFVSVGDTFKATNIDIFDSGRVTTEMIRNTCDKFEVDGKEFDIIIVDHIQLMSVTGKYQGRESEISEITRQLKVLAKDKKMLVLALSQLNRGLGNREDKRPTTADLKGSGAIEQDADKVFFLYRHWYYNKETANKNDMEVLFEKNRQGKIGTGHLIFFPEWTKFSNKKWYKED